MMRRGVLSVVFLLLVLLTLGSKRWLKETQEPINARLVDITLITNGTTESGLPLWSPDGKKIAFSGDGTFLLCMMNSDGSGQIEVLTEGIGVGGRKAWSPDSRRIAFVSRLGEGKPGVKYQVRVVDVQTKEVRAISDSLYGVGRPSWTRSGDIVYSGDGNLVIADTNGTIQSSIVGEPGAGIMILSPDETKILYSKDDSLWIMNTDGTDNRQLMQRSGKFFAPIFSPDGLSVAVMGIWGPRGLYVVDMEGQMTTLDERGGSAGPAWSPDGEYLIYHFTEDDGHYYTSADLYLIRRDGTGKVQLTDTEDFFEIDACFSPDGKRVAFATIREGKIYVATLEIEEGEK